jgi:hypothetical protein
MLQSFQGDVRAAIIFPVDFDSRFNSRLDTYGGKANLLQQPTFHVRSMHPEPV